MAEKKQISKYQKIQKKYAEKTYPLFKEADAKKVYDAIANGDNYYLRSHRVETSLFDQSWIDTIEGCINDLGEIVKDPRKITKTVANLVPVELAKKTNSESVRHLASHTQFVKEIKENGDVVPSKILSIESDDDYAIYENRFIATLIKRLVLFVEKRHEFILKYTPLKDIEELKIKSTSVVDGSLVEITTNVKITKPADYAGVEEENALMERVSNIRKYLRFYYGTPFMKLMKNEKDVRNPILMTNIIRKNPLYNHCYRLYKYIESYDGLGIEYSIHNTYEDFDSSSFEDANAALMAAFLALKPQDPSRFASEKTKTYRPKVLKSIDDEEFEYGDLLEGPIEFVRVDEKYREATEEKIKFDQQGRYDAATEAFIEPERMENRCKKLLTDAKNSLMSRKKKEAASYEKKVLGLIARREAEERERIRQEEEARRAEEERLKEEARKELISEAESDANAANKK